MKRSRQNLKLRGLLESINSNLINVKLNVKQIIVSSNELKYKEITDYYRFYEFEVIGFYLENDNIMIII